MYINDLYSNYASNFSTEPKFTSRSKSFSHPISKNIDTTNVLRSNAFTDNVDVSTTGGDDTFAGAYGISLEALHQQEMMERGQNVSQSKDAGDAGSGEGETDGMALDDIYKSKSSGKTPIKEETNPLGEPWHKKILKPVEKGSKKAVKDGNIQQKIWEEDLLKTIKTPTKPPEEVMYVKQAQTGFIPVKPPTKKANKYYKKIAIPDLIVNAKQKDRIITRKQAYIDLMSESGKKPDKGILTTGDLQSVTLAIKKQFPDYYSQNIAKKK